MDREAQDRLVSGLKHFLLSLEGHQDAVLIEYILVLLGSGKERKAVVDELNAFMSSREHAERLVRWLFDNVQDHGESAQTSIGTSPQQPQQPPKNLRSSVQRVAAGASVGKPRANHGVLKSVIDSVIRTNNNHKGEVKDARDIINSRRRSTDDTAMSRTVTTFQEQRRQSATENTPNQLTVLPTNNTVPKKTTRCPDFPDCPKSDQDCPMVHPKELCKYFPNCLFGKDCLFLHPPVPCRFGDRCQNAVCNFTHTPHNTVVDGPLNIPCRFNEHCRRPNCPFLHTVAMPCPQGAQCMKPACPFKHPSEHALPAPRALVNRPCKFGRACAKADCPFQHPKPVESAVVQVEHPNKEP